MDYIKLYRRFVYSHYFSEGLRMSVGVLLPALVAGYFGYLQKGIFISLGALCVSITDNPGPIHHRRNGMLVACGLIAGMALIVGFSLQVQWLFLIILPISCFLFSMIAVYGARATSIGIGALLVMVMMTHQDLSASEVGLFTLLLFAGGIWYTGLSIVLNRLQPYKLIQQVLGEYILSAADYLRHRAQFYQRNINEETAYQQLMQLQVAVQQKQDMVAELLFKTRGFVKESNKTSRILMMAYLDVSDLLERSMTAHFDYKKLHDYFDDTDILQEYQHLITRLAGELENAGISLISQRRSTFSEELEKELGEERKKLVALRQQRLSAGNLEGFISLRQILDSMIDIATRIRTLHQYTHFKEDVAGKPFTHLQDAVIITRQDYSWQLFRDNLSWSSNIFRHSVRVTIAAMVAYIGGMLWSFGHNYWILLTVIFILKPGFGLTRTRNKERIIGTLIGSVIAGIFLFLIKNSDVILVLLTVFMIAGYSFMRWKYMISTLFITVYLLMLFHLLEPQSFSVIVKDRVIDTLIGCGIAFLAMRAIPSVWEKVHISTLLRETITRSTEYFQAVAAVFTGSKFDKAAISKQRKAAWVALANLSDAFNRMLSEPQGQQKNSPEWHRVVVATHMIVSHTATLGSYAENISSEYISKEYEPLIHSILVKMEATAQLTGGLSVSSADASLPNHSANADDPLANRLRELLQTRQQELNAGMMEPRPTSYLSTFKTITDQFYFIQNAVAEIEKVCVKVITRPVVASAETASTAKTA